MSLITSKKESKKRGLRTEEKYIEARKAHSYRQKKKVWGGRRFNKEADPVTRSKSPLKQDQEGRLLEEGRRQGIYRRTVNK